MTTPDQRLEELKKAHFDAADNFVADCLAATTQAEKNRIAQNLLRARGAHETAILDGMMKNNGAIENAFAKLKAANEDVARARAEAQAIADVIKKVTEVVKFGTKLVSLAII